MAGEPKVIGHRFNPAPGWDAAPDGWLPPRGWVPPAEWPPAPEGWELVTPIYDKPVAAPPAGSEDSTVTPTNGAGPGDGNLLPPLPARSVPAFGKGKFAAQLLQEVTDWHAYANRLKSEVLKRDADIERLGLSTVVDLERQAEAIAEANRSATAELEELRRAVDEASSELIEVRDRADLESSGFYTYQHPAESSLDLQTKLTAVQADIKAMVRSKTAVAGSSTFTFNGSTVEGKRWVADNMKLMLRAFNAEAENCIKTVRAGNLAVAQKRLTTAAATIEKLGARMGIAVTRDYQKLRLKELQLAAEYQDRVRDERDREREHREELREAARVEKELAAAREKLARERQQYLNAAAALEEKGDLEGAARVRLELERVDEEIASVDYRAANIRAGYVYVISNIGAFGERMVKVGVTRRLEPRDRIRELGDASVPFRFDTHAIIFADDAVTLETKLHQALADRRVNTVNLRREFFYATPAEVKELVREVTSDFTEMVEFNEYAEADEYRVSSGAVDGML